LSKYRGPKELVEKPKGKKANRNNPAGEKASGTKSPDWYKKARQSIGISNKASEIRNEEFE
jgi:hypothetical protein